MLLCDKLKSQLTATDVSDIVYVQTCVQCEQSLRAFMWPDE